MDGIKPIAQVGLITIMKIAVVCLLVWASGSVSRSIKTTATQNHQQLFTPSPNREEHDRHDMQADHQEFSFGQKIQHVYEQKHHGYEQHNGAGYGHQYPQVFFPRENHGSVDQQKISQPFEPSQKDHHDYGQWKGLPSVGQGHNEFHHEHKEQHNHHKPQGGHKENIDYKNEHQVLHSLGGDNNQEIKHDDYEQINNGQHVQEYVGNFNLDFGHFRKPQEHHSSEGHSTEEHHGFVPKEDEHKHEHDEKHQHEVKTITVTKTVPVPYTVEVEKKVPYKVEVPVDKPYTVEVPKPYPVYVEKKVPYTVKEYVPQPYTVYKKVPFTVKVHVDKPYNVPVPKPYHVVVEKKIPYHVEKHVPYPVRVYVDKPYPVHVPIYKHVPYTVEKKVPYPVKVPFEKPYPVPVPKPYMVFVEKKVPFSVENPYPVHEEDTFKHDIGHHEHHLQHGHEVSQTVLDYKLHQEVPQHETLINYSQSVERSESKYEDTQGHQGHRQGRQ